MATIPAIVSASSPVAQSTLEDNDRPTTDEGCDPSSMSCSYADGYTYGTTQSADVGKWGAALLFAVSAGSVINDTWKHRARDKAALRAQASDCVDRANWEQEQSEHYFNKGDPLTATLYASRAVESFRDAEVLSSRGGDKENAIIIRHNAAIQTRKTQDLFARLHPDYMLSLEYHLLLSQTAIPSSTPHGSLAVRAYNDLPQNTPLPERIALLSAAMESYQKIAPGPLMPILNNLHQHLRDYARHQEKIRKFENAGQGNKAAAVREQCQVSLRESTGVLQTLLTTLDRMPVNPRDIFSSLLPEFRDIVNELTEQSLTLRITLSDAPDLAASRSSAIASRQEFRKAAAEEAEKANSWEEALMWRQAIVKTVIEEKLSMAPEAVGDAYVAVAKIEIALGELEKAEETLDKAMAHYNAMPKPAFKDHATEVFRKKLLDSHALRQATAQEAAFFLRLEIQHHRLSPTDPDHSSLDIQEKIATLYLQQLNAYPKDSGLTTPKEKTQRTQNINRLLKMFNSFLGEQTDASPRLLHTSHEMINRMNETSSLENHKLANDLAVTAALIPLSLVSDWQDHYDLIAIYERALNTFTTNEAGHSWQDLKPVLPHLTTIMASNPSHGTSTLLEGLIDSLSSFNNTPPEARALMSELAYLGTLAQETPIEKSLIRDIVADHVHGRLTPGEDGAVRLSQSLNTWASHKTLSNSFSEKAIKEGIARFTDIDRSTDRTETRDRTADLTEKPNPASGKKK